MIKRQKRHPIFIKSGEIEKGLLQNKATAPKTIQKSTSSGCRGGHWPPAGDESSPLQILLTDFCILQQSLQTEEKASQNFLRSKKQSQNHFASGRVPDAKYASGCKCGIWSLTANKFCAQQTAKICRKAPKGIFDTLRRVHRNASLLL